MRKILSLILIGVLMMSVSGCGRQKYRLIFDGYGFEARKTEYAAGETVTVTYDFIATDTDYHFYIDEDVEMKQGYDNARGYVFTFRMQAHDVTLHVESHNSMMYVPPFDGTDAEIEGIPAMQGDIAEFSYTYDWSGYDPLYQRYRFSAADGGYLFEHETRKAEGTYGWAAEADVTASGTVFLSVYEWDEFLYYLKGGSAAEPDEELTDGDSGPWMYLVYRAGEESVRREFHFADAERRAEFEEFCRSLAQN